MPEHSESGRAEAAHRECEERFHATFEQAAVGIAHVGADGRWLRVNRKLCDIVGYTRDELMGLTPRDITHPDDRDSDAAESRLLQAGETSPYSTQKRYVRKDGSLACVKLTVSVARAGGDRPSYLVLVAEDVAERRLTEQQLRTLADSIPQLCWMADPEGYVVWYNRRWAEYTGKSLQDMWGRRWVPVLGAEVQSGVLARWLACVAAGQPFDMELPIRGKDGTFRPFFTRVEPVRDGGGTVVRWVGTGTEITDRKRTEDALRERERTYRIVADNTFDFEFWRDPRGRYLYVSPSCERVTGHTPAEYIADPDLLLSIVHPDDRPWVGERMRALLNNPAVGEFEFRVVHRDGTVRWLAQACQPVYSAGDEYLGVRGSNREVTERKRAEEAFKDADRRKDEFLAVLAHELRTPLAPLRNALHVLRLSPDPEVLERTRALMQRQLDQVVRLVDDLLDVSRISTGKLRLSRERVDLRAAVEGAVEASRPVIDRMGHHLTVTFPNQTLAVDADPARLGRVFVNLLDNAAKYTDRGGHIQLVVERQGSDVLVSVKDDGIGIAAAQLPGVFGVSSQVAAAMEKSQGGLGGGLTLVRRLVELHGGRVEARSEGPGRGAEFVVRLPLVEGSGPTAGAGRGEAVPSRAELKILIADDNRDAADCLGMLLRIMGNDVRTAYDGERGLAAAAEFRPDMALLDIGLPKVDGYTACRRIRGQSWGKKMVLIAVTGWGQEEDSRRSHDAGFDHYMVKPVDPTALMRMLAEFQKAMG